MTPEIIVGLLSLMGTFLGVIGASKLMSYRIEQLEKKMDKHNSVIERFVILEENAKAQWRRIDELKASLEELRKEIMK